MAKSQGRLIPPVSKSPSQGAGQQHSLKGKLPTGRLIPPVSKRPSGK